MAIPVKLEVFVGPLDLLLHLIEKNKVNIYDIPIVLITKQYLSYISQMETKDMDIMSEFLVMAATLIHIKSKMLLPKDENKGEEEEDPREELVRRLLEYKMYKYMSYELKDRQVVAGRMFFKAPDIPAEAMNIPEEEVDLTKLLNGLTLERLHQVFHSLIKKQTEKIDPIRSKFGIIEKEHVNQEEKMKYVEEFAKIHRYFSFLMLFDEAASKMDVVVTFLSILELMKTGKITISQEAIFDEIYITYEGEHIGGAEDKTDGGTN